MDVDGLAACLCDRFMGWLVPHDGPDARPARPEMQNIVWVHGSAPSRKGETELIEVSRASRQELF